MARPSIAELAGEAAKANKPRFVTELNKNLGGVDPLGLRQINFDLMDEVLPGLNNTARHIRPFVVIAWAWRQANRLAQELGAKQIEVSALQDFVDRIEVMFVISQFLRDPKADLPGGEYLAPLRQETKLVFDGPAWKKLRKVRADSTALSAPVSYGPGLKSLGWIKPHPDYPKILLAAPEVDAALDALERALTPALKHDAFSALGGVTVRRADLERWGELWALDRPTRAEARVMSNLLIGPTAPLGRRLGLSLLLDASSHRKSTEAADLRAAMCGVPSKFKPRTELLGIRDTWRAVQVRQLLRLSLESSFFWMMRTLGQLPCSIDTMVSRFLDRVPTYSGASARRWLEALGSAAPAPTELMERIQQDLVQDNLADLPHSIALGLARCLGEPSGKELVLQQPERLPLWRAQAEAEARASGSITEFMRHVLESWVLAQHAYWSVGRGLADARANGNALLRLRVILDEGGWTLTPGASAGNPPRPTPDRLDTAVSLAKECGLFEQS